MKNRYPGTCQKCGGTVPAEKGMLEKRDGKWIVTHAGKCAQAPAPAPAHKATRKESVPPVEGEYTVTRRSRGRDDCYEVGEVIAVDRGTKFAVVIESGKYRDDDTDGWMLTARVRPATEAEATPVKTRREARQAAKAAADTLAADLRAAMHAELVDGLPAGAVDLWVEQRMAGSERWSLADGSVYYTESDYDMGQMTWRTTATAEQVAALKATSLYRPGLLEAK